jgi:flagellin
VSLIVNTNVGSLNAQRSLAASGAELKTAMERLSSGKKINSAADDAAGFAIAERMTAQIRGLNMATKNVNDGLALISVVDNALSDVGDILQRIRELAIQASNDTNGTEDRIFLQTEVTVLVMEINRIADQTTYNGQKVLDGSFSNKSIQVGTESGQKVDFSINGIKPNEIGIDADANASPPVLASYVDNIDISLAETEFGAQAGLQVITAAIEQIAGDRASYGALQNRLEYTVSNLMNVAEFTTAARSRIEDADFAAESARLAKAQVLQQTGTAMLAQANAQSQLALSLIR